MIYFDTAYLVKCYVDEDGSDAVRELARRSGRIACSEYGRLELHGAFHRLLREEVLDKDYFRTVLEQFDIDHADGIWHWHPLNRALFAEVTSLFRTLPEHVNLRTGDAVHLCSARLHGADRIYSNDGHLLRAASFVQLDAANVLER